MKYTDFNFPLIVKIFYIYYILLNSCTSQEARRRESLDGLNNTDLHGNESLGARMLEQYLEVIS